MLKRIDALGVRPPHLGVLTGAILYTDPDEVLQRIVYQASRQLAAPMALVSILLERTQFFRAHCGLPTDLAIACSTDRDASFCQFVVRNKAIFEVNQAATDRRVPQELVERYGIQSYLGFPVRVGDQIVGSLCVIDTKPRDFTADEQCVMTELAAQATQRLTVLSTIRKSPWPLLGGATRPVFAELRNILVPLTANVALARVAAADLGPLGRLAEYLSENQLANLPALGSLAEAARAVDDLRESLDDFDQLMRRLQQDLVALEGAVLGDRSGCRLSEVVSSADRLARHLTKLVGGVAWPELPGGLQLSAPRGIAIAVLSFLLTSLAEMLSRDQLHSAAPRGIRVLCQLNPECVDMVLQCESLGGHQHEFAVNQVAMMLPHDESIQVFSDHTATIVRLNCQA